MGKQETLVSLAEQAGLDRQQTVDMLASKRFGDAVREDQLAAVRLGVRGVPYFLVDGRHAISGAQPVSAITQALLAARRENKDSQDDVDGSMCSVGIC
ncbi:DsbA family oxidoreductase [Paenibacillus aestuarii]|uniref:DsbA family oxidoreductase n=1 Tax=Paenibacillus aestuarii TaxID=516965 RepID=UPI0038CD9C3D